jgi:hypothetical protein
MARKLWLAATAVAMLFVSGSLAGVSIDLVGEWGGCADAVAVAGNTAYLGVGLRLVVLDISEPSNPVFLAQSQILGSLPIAVVVQGAYAYVATQYDGLHIFDVSDPSAPRWVGWYDDAGYCYDVQVAGNYAYLVGHYAGLQIVDVSNPAAPFYVGGFQTSNFCRALAIEGHYVYVSTWYTIDIVDVADPAAPVRVGIFPTGQNDIDGEGLVVVNGYAYLADGMYCLAVIDVSDPSAPWLVGRANAGWVNGFRVAVAGSYAYVGDMGGDVWVLDVSNPAAPNKVARCGLDGWVSGVVLDGNYAYAANWWAGMQVLDVSTPSAPLLAGVYDETTHAQYLDVHNGYAYLTGYRPGVQIVDVSDPTSMTRVAECLGIGRFGLHVSGSYLYAAQDDNGLGIADVSNPAAPVLVGACKTTAAALDVAVAGSYAYVADTNFDTNTGGLTVVDVSAPSMPQVVATCSTGSAWGSYRSGNYAYISDYYTGLNVIDVSVPTNPVWMGNGVTWDYGRDAVVSNDVACMASCGAGLEIYDVSDPANPEHIGNFPSTGWFESVAQRGHSVYVIDYWLRVIDQSDPTAPVQLAYRYCPASPLGLAVDGAYVYIADAEAGLIVMAIRFPADMNCDGDVDFGDINPFVTALSDPAAYEEAFPNCRLANGDTNDDGTVDLADINPFIACLINGGCP